MEVTGRKFFIRLRHWVTPPPAEDMGAFPRRTLHSRLCRNWKKCHCWTVSLVLALHRLMPTAQSIAGMWADVRQWNIVLWGLLLSSVYLGLVKGKEGRSRLLVTVLMLFSSFVIVIFHPSDVHWLVAASWNRITAQTLPLFLVVIIPSLSMRAASRDLTHEG